MSNVEPKEVKVIPINSIMIAYRYRQDMGDLKDLKQSVIEHGLITPITVKEIEPYKDYKYELLAGGRRYTVCKDLGYKHMAANIYPIDLTELERRLIELKENIDRKDMEYAEQVSLTNRIDRIMNELKGKKVSGAGGTGVGHSLAQTAQMLGKSKTTVSEDIKLAKAIEIIPELADMKNKKEAMRYLKKMAKEIEHEEIMDEIRDNRKGTTEDQIRRKLCDSYIVGDTLEEIKKIQNSCMDLVEVDTPFAISLDKEGMKRSGKEIKKDYNEWIAEEFKEKCQFLIDESYRILKPNGWIVWWFAPDPWWTTVAEILYSENRFKGKAMPGIWTKSGSSGQTNNPDLYMGNIYEMFFYGRKGDAKLNKEGRGNEFEYKPVNPESKIHPTEKPINMMVDIYSTFLLPGSHICIPFLGSGNGILAAANYDCKAFGWDLSSVYKTEYELRVHKGLPGEYSSYKKGI